MWSLLAVVLVLAVVLIVRHREEANKAAATVRPAPGTTVTSATAQKGNIGVYLDSIGTVTPVYTDSGTVQHFC
jgi:membrane fusion protein, multidrug efflux system